MLNNDLFSSYDLLPNTWDEMYNNDSKIRTQYDIINSYLQSTSPEVLFKKEELLTINKQIDENNIKKNLTYQ